MCGVVALYAYRGHSINRDELRAIRDHMAARGPDGQGEWFSDDGRLGMGHRRLSIIDLNERALQPMLSADGRFTLSFNGEIYNYKALRSELEEKGYAFRTQSDTEVILQLYADRGQSMLECLRGMFAIALFDTQENKLLIARDPYGIKPLYYSDDGHVVRIASQVKALLAGRAVSQGCDPAGLAGFYLFGSVPEPYTIYESIHAVPAGSCIMIDENGLHTTRRYFSVSETFCNLKPQNEDGKNKNIICNALLDSVKHHLVSDVAVGAFLSSGIDSGSLVGLIKDVDQGDVKSVTLSFTEFSGQHRDESQQAQRVANHYGTIHSNRTVTETEFREDLPRILDAMDQPSIDGVNTWFVSKAAKELGLKVAISGLGGDELFGGYPSFNDIPRWNKWVRPVKYAASAFGHILQSVANINAKASGLLQYGHDIPGAYLVRRGLFMPWELPELMGEEMAREGLARLRPLKYIADTVQPAESKFGVIAALESSLYMRNQLLRDADWAGMAHSLEIRVPLVDSFLLQKVASHLVSSNSLNRKEYLANSPTKTLPRDVMQRAKFGFETPISEWLNTIKYLQSWRSKSSLLKANCHWSRRWAYEVIKHIQEASYSAFILAA